MTDLDDFFGDEPLHDDLVPHLSNWRLGRALFHPLVHEPLYHELQNKHYNRVYLSKKTALAKAITDKNWSSYIFIHERPYRLEALMDVIHDYGVRTPGKMWPLIADVWIDSENIFQGLEEWTALWAYAPNKRIHFVMDDAEKEALRELPEVIPVYRGFTVDGADAGLSWTTDREKAEWFARRFRQEGVVPKLASGTISKEKVLAYFLGRGENEIVAFPDDVLDQTVVEL